MKRTELEEIIYRASMNLRRASDLLASHPHDGRPMAQSIDDAVETVVKAELSDTVDLLSQIVGPAAEG